MVLGDVKFVLEQEYPCDFFSALESLVNQNKNHKTWNRQAAKFTKIKTQYFDVYWKKSYSFHIKFIMKETGVFFHYNIYRQNVGISVHVVYVSFLKNIYEWIFYFA